MQYTHNEYRIKQTQKKQIPAKVMQEIVKRQEIAAVLKARERIEDYKNDVFSIIEDHGLNNDDSKTKLETALKVLPYIIPQKKAMEMTVTHKTIEQIIQETIPEAEYTEEEAVTPDGIKTNEDNTTHTDNK